MQGGNGEELSLLMEWTSLAGGRRTGARLPGLILEVAASEDAQGTIIGRGTGGAKSLLYSGHSQAHRPKLY